jgi:hypothetical protein
MSEDAHESNNPETRTMKIRRNLRRSQVLLEDIDTFMEHGRVMAARDKLVALCGSIGALVQLIDDEANE